MIELSPLDRMQMRTDEFRETLTHIESIEGISADDTVLADRRMLNAGILTRNALYVRDMKQGLGDAPYHEFEFEPDAARLQGATDSQHCVIFGKLHTYDDSLAVAVKPYDGGKAAALRELVAYEFMAGRGFDCFIPLGIVAAKGRTFLITKDEPSLKTFDNMRWSPDALAQGDIGPEQVELLGLAGRQLGAMHAEGITHGDAQPRNTAVSERGKVGFIDFESLIYHAEGLGTDFMSRKIADDILNFYGKLRRPHEYCKEEDARTRLQQFDEQFLQAHEEAYHNKSGANNRDIKRRLVGLRVNVIKFILTEEASLIQVR